MRQPPEDVSADVRSLSLLLKIYPEIKSVRIRRGGPNSNVNIIQIEFMDDYVFNLVEPK